MKNIFPFICTALMAVGFMTSCGSDEDSPAGEIVEGASFDTRKSVDNSNDLKITFNDDLTSASTQFAANNAGGISFAVELAGVNGKKIAEYPAVYSAADNMYHVNFTNLTAGNLYYYHIIAYDAEGNYVSRGNEGSFTLPQLPGPGALTGLVPHAPTRALTIISELNIDGSYSYKYTCDGYITGESINPGVEYSIDGGETWESAEADGIIEYLPIGSVLVRVAATTSNMAGEAVEVIIPGNTDFDGEGGYAEGENARAARLTK